MSSGRVELPFLEEAFDIYLGNPRGPLLAMNPNWKRSNRLEADIYLDFCFGDRSKRKTACGQDSTMVHSERTQNTHGRKRIHPTSTKVCSALGNASRCPLCTITLHRDQFSRCQAPTEKAPAHEPKIRRATTRQGAGWMDGWMDGDGAAKPSKASRSSNVPPNKRPQTPARVRVEFPGGARWWWSSVVVPGYADTDAEVT
ncbi:hypothetical protein K438DRAFT_914922 [Mycena galopus ATCC 62051]|nr:hypothetical protein K438DRAFT_914922 [Mycena galopus ATCC 62051]